MIIMVILSIIMSLFIAIQDPIIQKFTIRIAGGYLSSKTGADVQIGSLNISPNFTISFDDLVIKDLQHNELLKIDNLKVHPYMEDLIHGNIHLGRIELNHASANLVTYEGEDKMNLQFLIDAFASNKEKQSSTSPPIQIDRVVVNGLDFQFWNQNKDAPEKQEQHLMDYAHLDLKDIRLDLEGLTIIGDSITGLIHDLSAKETSGFELKHLASKVNVSSHGILMDGLLVETPHSHLDLDLHMLYPGYYAFRDFVDSVTFDTRIRPTQVLLSDLGPFTKTLYEMPDSIRFEGLFQGPIKEFEVNDLQFDFGKETHFEGNLAMHPLDFFNGKHRLTIERMHYSLEDLSAFHIPGRTGTIPLPDIIAPMERGTIRGGFEGSYRNFKTRLFANSEVGAVSATIKKHVNEEGFNVFESTIDGEQLNIGALVNNPQLLGNTDISAHVTGKQRKNGSLELDIDGDIYNADLLGNTLNEISMNGNLHDNIFNGKIDIQDDELVLDFKGRIDFSNPQALGGDFQANIVSADLRKLNLLKNEEKALLSATITANGNHFNDFNKAEGTLVIQDFSYKNSKGVLDMDELNATIVNDNLMQKKIQVNCDFLDFEMAGKMDFPTLVTAIKQTIVSYAEIPQWTEELEAFEKLGKTSDQDFIVNLNVKDPQPFTQLFVPNLSIAKNTTLKGTFTSRSRSLNMTLRSKSIRFNNFRVNNIECRSISSPRRLVTRLNLDQIVLRDSTEFDSTMITLDNFTITNTLFNDSIRTDLAWDDRDAGDHNKAFVSTYFFPDLEGGAITVSQADILVNDSMWHLQKNGYIDFEDNKVRFKDICLQCNEQRMSIDGMMPRTAEDTLSLSFDQFDLSTLDFIFRGRGFDLDGTVYGDATVSDLQNEMSLLADMEIRQLGFNGEIYGDADIYSRWDHNQDAILLDVGLRHQQRKLLALTGGYYTKRENDNLDFSLDVDSLNLSMASPFLKGVVERVQGYCVGNLTVKGSAKQPSLQGAVRVIDGGGKVNFLNTFYTFSPTIEITDRTISFSDLTLTDTLGNNALVFGRISHDHLKDMRLNFRLFPDNFLAMATNAQLSPKFFGNAVASGMVEVNGPVNDLTLDINAMTEKGTVMTIPLGGKSGVSKHEFITFVSKDRPNDENEDEEMAKPKGKQKNNLHLGLNLDVNDNAQIKISLPNNLGTLEAKGNGNIKLGMESNALSLIGDYVIKNGSLSLVIEELFKRNFTLEEGSRISWTGDPVNGTINATGVYQTKTSLSTLGLGDTLNASSNSLKVECLVHLNNRLMNPDITFGFRFPGASDDLQQAIYSIIDTTNQAEVLMQSIYLMVMNSFNYSGNANSYYGIVTSQINDFLSQLTNDLDINFNYRPGDDYSNEEMTIALKKQLFDDRVTIETNFGVALPTSTYSGSSTNIIGDFNVDVKLTKDGRLSAQVFNRSNYNTYYYQYSYYKTAPYTQGIGLSYGRSFDRFKDLFKKRKTIPVSNRPLARPRKQNELPKP